MQKALYAIRNAAEFAVLAAGFGAMLLAASVLI